MAEAIPSRRRIVGPIPPRDEKGRFLIRPIMAERVKKNALGEIVRDKDGNPVMEMADQRDPSEYLIYEPGHDRHMAEHATKGLTLFRCDLRIEGGVHEPIYLVFAKSADEAERVYRREVGVVGRLPHNAELHVSAEVWQ